MRAFAEKAKKNTAQMPASAAEARNVAVLAGAYTAEVQNKAAQTSAFTAEAENKDMLTRAGHPPSISSQCHARYSVLGPAYLPVGTLGRNRV